MFKTIHRLFALEPQRRRWGYGVLFLTTVLNSGLEVIGIAMIIPLIAIVANPDAITAYPYLNLLPNLLGIESWNGMVLVLCMLFAGIVLIKNVYAVAFAYALLRFVSRGAESFTHRLLKYYISVPYMQFLQRNSAEMINSVTRQARGAYSVVSTALINLCADVTVALAIFAFLLFQSPIIVLTSLVVITPMFFIQHRIYSKRLIVAGAQLLQDSESQISSLQDCFRSIRETKVYGREASVLRDFNAVQRSFSKHWMTGQVLSRLPALVAEVVLVVCVCASLIYLVLSGEQASSIFGTLGLLAAAFHRLVPLMNRALNSISLLYEHSTAIDLLSADIRQADRLERETPKDAGVVLKFEEAITLDRVSLRFADADAPIIDEISVRIGRGEVIGIAGKTGAGKTTLVNILIGLIRPTGGIVRVDDADIQGDIRAWQRNIAYVPQSVFISDVSVRANIVFDTTQKSVDDAEIWHVLDQVALREVVEAMPEGLNTQLGEHGARLSGGQAQRLGLARALYADRPVIMLDEATSALDNVTERQVSAVINSLRGKKTVILIAHRLQTLQDCDRVVYLAAGRIAALDTLDALVEKIPDFFRNVSDTAPV